MTAKAKASRPVRKHPNAPPPLEQRHASAPGPGGLAPAVVLLMQPMDGVTENLSSFIGPQLEPPVLLPVLPVSPMKLIANRGEPDTRGVQTIHVPCDMGHTHWGLNE